MENPIQDSRFVWALLELLNISQKRCSILRSPIISEHMLIFAAVVLNSDFLDIYYNFFSGNELRGYDIN
jgi:hypothetical protein